MLRKILVIMLGCLLPIQASAASWSLNTWVKTRGGSIMVRGGKPQTVTNGATFKSYSTHAAFNVVVTADAGYAIRNVTVNRQTATTSGNSYTATVQGMGSQMVWASFTPSFLSVTARVTSNGGTVSPANIGNIALGTTLNAPLTFTFTSQGGYYLNTLTGAEGATVSAPLPAIDQRVVKVTFPKGYVFTAPLALNGAFTSATPMVSASLPQSAAVGDTVTLTAKTIAGPAATSYSWSQLSGPATVTLTPAGNNASFTTSTVGTYVFRVAVDGGSAATTSVTVSNSLSTGTRNVCQFCHSASKVGAPDIFPNWSASAHRVNRITCDKCHTTHPLKPTADVCLTCHFSGGDSSAHPFAMGNNVCTTCHNAHSLQALGAAVSGSPALMSNHTSVSRGATYVTTNIGCLNCHAGSSNNSAIRQQWAATGHAGTNDAPFTTYDFKTRAGCVQCHTTTGFIAYSTGKVSAAWGAAGDKTKEVIACIACHVNVSAGTVRTVKPVQPYADAPAYANREAGESNLCFDCHSGRTTGNAIQSQVGTANFGNTAFVAPHYLAAGATIYGKGGYNYAGQTYAGYSANSHRVIGVANAAGTGNGGPCVGCHMSSSAKHSLQAAATDANGTVTAIASSACAGCHADSLDAAALNGKKVAFNSALNILKVMLADKGYAYTPNYPYFAAKNWGNDQAGADVMGAAYNYKLLLAEPGAYAHNGAYAKKLIVDSIDLLYNGSITGSIDSALAYLVDKGAISQADADGLAAYQKSSSCNSCHSNTSGSHPAHLAQQIGCATCHAATAANNTTLVNGNDKHANGVKDVFFSVPGSYNGPAKSCSGIYCHSDGLGQYANMVWGSGKLSCKSCHPNLSGAHAAHVGNLLDSVTSYGDAANASVAGSYQFGCGSCHPTDGASHMNGKVDVTLVPDTAAGTLRAKNSPTAVISGVGQSGSGIAGTSGVSVTCSAAYCHSNGRVGGPLAYATSPDWYNAAAYTGDKCAMCHANAPTTGAHAAHVVGIHYNQIADASGNLILGHGDEAQSTTINCDLCHSVTVTNFNNDNNASCGSCHLASDQGTGAKGTPQLDKSRHLNGTLEVAFKGITMVSKAQVRPLSFGKYSSVWTRTTYKAGTGSYDFSKLPLSSGSFDATGKNCSNVACHNGKSPNWNAKLTCVDCHSTL